MNQPNWSKQKIHVQMSRDTHFTVDAKSGAACPNCKVRAGSACHELSRNTVHIERVRAMGYNVNVPGE